MRLWEVRFEVYRVIPSVPRPSELVDEIQTSAEYVQDGRFRGNQKGGQFVFTVEGTGGFRCRGREYRLKPGTAFLHNHFDTEVAYFYPPEAKGTWRFLWISFMGRMVEQIIAELVERYGYLYRIPRNSALIKRLESYRNYRGLVHALTPLEGGKMVSDILAGIGEFYESRHRDDPKSVLVRKAQEFIFENMEKDVGISQIADSLQVSREHLARVFRENAGIPPSEYINQKKMKFACHLLKDTNLSCREVAARVGYGNPNSFTRAFRKIIGFSPSEIKRTGYIPAI